MLTVNCNELIVALGPVAHLVERLICTEEVAGSSPVWSTDKNRLLGVFLLDYPIFFNYTNHS